MHGNIPFYNLKNTTTHKRAVVINACAREKKSRRRALRKTPDGKFLQKKAEGDTSHDVDKYVYIYSEFSESTIAKVQI